MKFKFRSHILTGGKRSFNSIESAAIGDKWDGKEGDTSHLNKPSERIEVWDIGDGGDDDEIRSRENGIIEFPKKRISGIDYGNQKMLFNPWGGKKRSQNYDELRNRFDSILPSSNELQGHQIHGRFWPWGG